MRAVPALVQEPSTGTLRTEVVHAVFENASRVPPLQPAGDAHQALRLVPPAAERGERGERGVQHQVTSSRNMRSFTAIAKSSPPSVSSLATASGEEL